MSKLVRLVCVLSLVFVGVLVGGVVGCTSDKKSGGDAGGDGGRSDGAVADANTSLCTGNADCDDGLYCTGTEACRNGVCVSGKPVVCSDGVACTIDRCSEKKHACEFLPPDADGDGHYDAKCKNKAGKVVGDDCDDTDPLRFPGNIEACDPDNKDDDCDPTTFGNKDSDNDGFYDAKCCNAASDAQGAKLNCGNDCDDLKANVNPKATEACDLFDNNCNGQTDEGVSIKMYPDTDHDGHGDTKAKTKPVQKCAGSVGFALSADDCNDKDPEVFTGEFEICDGKDNNCNGQIDEVHDDAPWFVDADKDGFGDATSTPVYSCERIPGRQLSNNDCDDTKAAVNPAAAELCDAIDNDCSGKKDYRLGLNDFEDDDNDGVADAKCTPGGTDCDDTDPTTGKGLEEVCDMRDNDCDGMVDEQTAQTVWYLDKDGDGWGINQGTALARCEPIPGRSSNLGDCDDTKNSVHPTALENCNGVDDNCNGQTDENTDYQCQLSNAVGLCKKGVCSVLSCYPGYDNCDNDPSNGCECKVPVVAMMNPKTEPCTDDASCDDGDYCNGKEHCNQSDHHCYAGTPVNCNASPTVLVGSFNIVTSLDIQTLAGIQTITGDLGVNAPGLQNLIGLESLTTIGGNLTISGNNAIVALVGSGLINLTTVGGNIDIESNPKLTTILFPNLVTAASITIASNDSLQTLDGFDNLVSLSGGQSARTYAGFIGLLVDNNKMLATFSGMKQLRSAGGPLSVTNNPRLTTLTGLTGLQQVAGTLGIYSNATTKIRLPALQTVAGDLTLSAFHSNEGNDATTTSIDLPALTSVTSTTWLDEMDVLQTLSMPLLQKAGGVSITNNSVLVDPDLHSLVQIGPDQGSQLQGYWHLSVQNDQLLTSVARIGTGKTTIHCPTGSCSAMISSNTRLPDCDVAALVARMFPAGSFSTVSWGGNQGPTDGGPICSSQGQYTP